MIWFRCLSSFILLLAIATTLVRHVQRNVLEVLLNKVIISHGHSNQHRVVSAQWPNPTQSAHDHAIYKESRFHSAKLPATTGVTNLSLFQFAHFLATFSASPNSFSELLSASASN